MIAKLTDLVMEKQSAENVLLPALHRTLEETEKAIGNLLNAIQMGIITESTKDRLTQLEQQKKEIELRITKEEIAHPTVTKEQIRFVFEKLRKLDLTKLEHRRKLIDIFVNAIYLYDDKILLTFNYKDGTKTIILTDSEEISGEGSDLCASGVPGEAYKKDTAPKNPDFIRVFRISRGEKKQCLIIDTKPRFSPSDRT